MIRETPLNCRQIKIPVVFQRYAERATCARLMNVANKSGRAIRAGDTSSSARRTRDKNTLAYSKRGSTSSWRRGTSPPCVTPCAFPGIFYRAEKPISARARTSPPSHVSHASGPRGEPSGRQSVSFTFVIRRLSELLPITMPSPARYAAPFADMKYISFLIGGGKWISLMRSAGGEISGKYGWIFSYSSRLLTEILPLKSEDFP